MSATSSATPSASTIAGATENNQRLFLRFRKVFSENNPREFTQFAEKLTKWLSDRKAYYEAARPEIIRLLLVAETTVRAALNVPSPELIIPFNVYEHPSHPLVPPYVSMVETVCRFEDLFEPAFKEYIKRMRANITPPGGHSLSPTMNDKHLSHLSGSETSQPPQAITQPLTDPDIQIIDKPQPSFPDGPPPPYSAHAETMPVSATQPSSSVRTRKVKKKKTLDFLALSQADIQDALLQQQRAQLGDNNSFEAEPLANSSHVTPNSQIPGSSNLTNLPQTFFPKAPIEPAKPPIDLTTSEVHRRVPTAQSPSSLPVISDTVPPPSVLDRSKEALTDDIIQQRPEENVIAPETTTTAGVTLATLFASPGPQMQDTLMEVDTHSEAGVGNSIDMQKDAAAPPPAAPDNHVKTQENVVHPTGLRIQAGEPRYAEEEARSTGPRSPSQPMVSGAAVIQTQDEVSGPTPQPETMSMDVDNEEQSHHLSLQEAEQNQPAMDIDSVHHTNADILLSGAENVPGQSGEPPLSRVQQENLPLPARDNLRVPSSISKSPPQPIASLNRSSGERAPPADIENGKSRSTERHLKYLEDSRTSNAIRSTTQNSIKSMALTGHQSTGDTFLGCGMRVIAIQKGPSKGSRITINFGIEKEKFLGIAIWRFRYTGQNPRLSELENSSICISLGCFVTDQLAAQSQKEGCDTIEKQLSALPSIWPTGGQVGIDVMFEGKRAKLPLAPPFQVTPDNFVDISQFANEGANVIQLSHQRDLSRYTFVLLVHHPTQAQLKEVREQQERDNEWTEWLTDLTKPFSVSLQPTAQLP